MTTAPKDLFELRAKVEAMIIGWQNYQPKDDEEIIIRATKLKTLEKVLALIDGLIKNLSSQEMSAKERNIKALKIIDERIKELEDIKGFYWQDEMWRKNVHTEYKELRAILGAEGK